MAIKHIATLDHGFVKLLNISGPTRRKDAEYDADSIDPANTARISFDNLNADRTREDDLKLVKYLIDNIHNTPVEMIEVWLEMKLPIFTARQLQRHRTATLDERTATINEVSGRYVQLPAEWYIPKIVGAKPTNGAKQGQENTLGSITQANFKANLHDQCQKSYWLYENALENGVAPEHARMFLHLNHYTHWVWKQDLYNILHFLKLRLDGHAQTEARVYAQAILQIISSVLPDLMAIYAERLGND